MQNKLGKLPLLLSALVLSPIICAAQEQSTSSQDGQEIVAGESRQDPGTPTLETVIVTGTLPGPSLWRVRDGKNELYILGSINPLPSKMTWDSSEVEEILARTQQVLAPSGAEASVGAGDAFKISLLARSANAATKIPERQKLEDLLPPPIFSAWQVLKAKYMPNDRAVERRRPIFSSQELYYSAIDASGMTRANVVWNRVEEMASEKGIAIRETKIKFPLALDRKKYKAGIDAIAESRADETTCFTETISSLESDLELMRKGANAWATGDLDLIRTLMLADPQPACKTAYNMLMGFQQRPELEVMADEAWLKAAKESLSNNATTLAVLPLHKLMGTSGMAERLRSAGYQVEAPDDGSDLGEVDRAPQLIDEN